MPKVGWCDGGVMVFSKLIVISSVFL